MTFMFVYSLLTTRNTTRKTTYDNTISPYSIKACV